MNTLNQEQLENSYSRRQRNSIILEELVKHDWFIEDVEQAVSIFDQFINYDYADPLKSLRLSAYLGKDVEQVHRMMTSILVAAVGTHEVPLVSLAAKVAYMFEGDKQSKIQTAAELLAILSQLQQYKLYRNEKKQYCITGVITLSADIQLTVDKLMYMPPLKAKPNVLEVNSDSAYHTIKESLILGHSMNHHEANISLDVLNTLNSVPLMIDWEVFHEMEKHLEIPEDNYNSYQDRFETTLNLIAKDIFYFNHKVDTRGRIYTSGHYINDQGDAFHKAIIGMRPCTVVPTFT